MEVGNLDDLIEEVWDMYPNRVEEAMKYVAEKYEINVTLAAHLVLNVWATMNHRYPMNLPRYLVFESKFTMN